MDNQNKKSAQGLAALGRGPDTELVHMTPSEVQGLQTLARGMGGQLTTNPRTGLPEAGFLDSIFPTIAGIGLAALTGGTSLAFMNPFTVGLGAGALTTAITGDLKKGLGVGLGVGGGYGLGTSLMGAGAGVGAGAGAGTGAADVATTGADLALTGNVGGAPLNLAESQALNLTGTGARDAAQLARQGVQDAARETMIKNTGGAFLPSGTQGITQQAARGAPNADFLVNQFNPQGQPFYGNTPFGTTSRSLTPQGQRLSSSLRTGGDALTGAAQTVTSTPDPSFFSQAYDRAGQNFDAMGRGITQIPTDRALRKSLIKPGIASLAGGALNVDPPKPFEIEDSGQKYFYPEGGYRTTKTAQTVASPQKDARGVFMPDMQEQTYFSPNQGDIVQVDPNARNYFGPEGTQPNFYGGGPSGNDNTAAYTPPPSMKGPFGITMNPSMNPNAEQYYYPIGGYRYAAQGGLMGFANGGLTAGPGDGMSDDIPAVIGGEQPAALSPGEFVVPADVVSDMGNGSSRAGARQLYSMMDRVRKARGGSVEQPEAINPREYMPA